MTKEEILKLRDTAEQTRVQFKERVTRENKYDVSCEMVALSNSRGGMIVVGIEMPQGRVNDINQSNRTRNRNVIRIWQSEEKRL